MRRLLLLVVVGVVFGYGQDPAVTRTPAAAQPPETTTTTAPTTTTETSTTTVEMTTTAAAKEEPLPEGARHGDQTEVVDHFTNIQTMTGCDALQAERAADLADRDLMLATRQEGNHRARAEVDDRWADQARHRMVADGCYQIAETK